MRTDKILALWQISRGIVLMAILAIIVFKAIKVYSWDLEFEYRGPGSQIEQWERMVEERERHEACERVGTPDERPGDAETQVEECV